MWLDVIMGKKKVKKKKEMDILACVFFSAGGAIYDGYTMAVMSKKRKYRKEKEKREGVFLGIRYAHGNEINGEGEREGGDASKVINASTRSFSLLHRRGEPGWGKGDLKKEFEKKEGGCRADRE